MSGDFVKRRPGDPDFFRAEAAGLRWLAETGAPVVEVREVTDGSITLARLEAARPSAAAARSFGAALAGMHDAGAPAFGSPPPGHRGRQFIGERPLPTGQRERWGEFYAADRVLPYLPDARANGYLTATDEQDVRAACEAVARGDFDDDAPPSRIHGDLWNGNVMWTPAGVVLIDPAAHGGHRETDLAMLALFGCPFLEEILDGYQEEHPLTAGWADRIPLHQLHPLAVHAAGHGPEYGRALGQAARAVLALGRRLG